MKNIFYGLLVYLLANFAHASENPLPLAEFNGEGEVKAEPDFISLTLSVASDCQATPSDAQRATDEVVVRVNQYLESLKDEKDPHFKILIDGGYTSPYSRYFKDRNICDKTFQKQTSITLKMGMRKDLDKLFARLQSHVLSNFDQMGFEGEAVARTYVSLNSPEPQLTPEHIKELSRKALDLAFKDAKANFAATITSCEPHRWKVASIKEMGGFIPPRLEYKAAPRAAFSTMAADNAMAAPVRFDRIRIQKTLLVGFSFEGSLCYDAK